MKRFIACLVGAALSAAAFDLAALSVPASAEQSTTKPEPQRDWSEGGRWLVPYEMPGYDGGYRESPPPQGKTAQAAPRQ